MIDSTEDWCKIWKKNFNSCVFKNDTMNLENFHRLKNSDFILGNKMAEINQNQKSNQRDRLDAVWKLYFTLEINE